jgi:glycerol-3-phosphate cytidylyltransferase
MRGFIASAFDFLHPGHILVLKECKRHCDYLVVGLHIDPSNEHKDKNKPVESVLERQIRLNACPYVDEIVVYETERDLEIILSNWHLGVRFLGSEYKNRPVTGEFIVPIKYVDRQHDYSSSGLRKRIYDNH